MLVKAAKNYSRNADRLLILMKNKGYIDMMSKCVIGKYHEYDDYLVRKLLRLASQQPRSENFAAELQAVNEEISSRDEWVKEHRPTSAPMAVFKDHKAYQALIQKLTEDAAAILTSADTRKFSRKPKEYRQAWHMAKETKTDDEASNVGIEDGSSAGEQLVLRGTTMPAMSLAAMHEYATGSNIENL